MIIRLREMARGPRHFDFKLGSKWWMADPNEQILGLDGPLVVHLTLFNEGGHYVVEGCLAGKLRVRCDRCLNAYFHDVQSEFRLLLASPSPEPVESEIELLEEDMSVEFLADDAIDTDHLIREQLYLALPIKFVCNEACRGLCPICGSNLNQEKCTCLEKKGHPAFLKLRELGFNSDRV